MIRFAFYQYIPKRYSRSIDFEQMEVNRLILDFKGGRNYAKRKVAHLIASAVSLMNLRNVCYVCIPASCKRTTNVRYKVFSNELCDMTGMVNAFDHVNVDRSRRKFHIARQRECNYSLDDKYFSRKKVVVFDDICTTGKSSEKFIEDIERCGAEVVLVLYLAKTKKFDKKRYN